MRYLIYIIYSRKYIDIEIIEFFKYFYIYVLSKDFYWGNKKFKNIRK